MIVVSCRHKDVGPHCPPRCPPRRHRAGIGAAGHSPGSLRDPYEQTSTAVSPDGSVRQATANRRPASASAVRDSAATSESRIRRARNRPWCAVIPGHKLHQSSTRTRPRRTYPITSTAEQGSGGGSGGRWSSSVRAVRSCRLNDPSAAADHRPSEVVCGARGPTYAAHNDRRAAGLAADLVSKAPCRGLWAAENQVPVQKATTCPYQAVGDQGRVAGGSFTLRLPQIPA
jgi:hypothetical protein